MMPHLMVYSVRNQAFGLAWRQKVLEPPRLLLRQILERAIARGRLPRTVDFDVAIALLLGPMMYRHIFKLLDHQPEVLAEAVVDTFWKAHASTPKLKPKSKAAARGVRHRSAATRPRRTAGAPRGRGRGAG